MTDFNLQQHLETMRHESREDTQSLTKLVTEGFEAASNRAQTHEMEDERRFNAMDGRLKPLEGVHTAAKWLLAAVVVAFLGAAADIYLHHVGAPTQAVAQERP